MASRPPEPSRPSLDDIDVETFFQLLGLGKEEDRLRFQNAAAPSVALRYRLVISGSSDPFNDAAAQAESALDA